MRFQPPIRFGMDRMGVVVLKDVIVLKLPELLSPAGDKERLEAALQFGADAVYLAMPQFGMRSAPKNFSKEELAEAVCLAHNAGAAVYITCNILPRNAEIDALPAYFEMVAAAGVDALIVADLGVMRLAKRYLPHTPLHVSTQLGVVNYETARMLYDLGASRIVLARELSLEEIAEIRAKTNASLALECFVHGAMCMSYSGRCLLSNYLTGRDANHGDCAQPCRWRYEVVEQSRPGQPITVEQTGKGTFLFNANDLNMIEHLPQLAAAGVSSLKIEGRAKAAYYVAAVTNAYRAALNGWRDSGFAASYIPSDWITEELDKVSHRPYGTGFYFGMPEQNLHTGGYIRTHQVAAVVESWRKGILTVSQRNRFYAGEILDVLEPGRPPFLLTVTNLTDEAGTAIPCAPHPTMRCRMTCSQPLRPGSLLRRKTNYMPREET